MVRQWFLSLCLVFCAMAFSSKASAGIVLEANLDFESMSNISHESKFINVAGISYFSLTGLAYGQSYSIRGLYSSQVPQVMDRCLALAEQLNLPRPTGARKPLLRIQVQRDPANSNFSRIQYCTLYQ